MKSLLTTMLAFSVMIGTIATSATLQITEQDKAKLQNQYNNAYTSIEEIYTGNEVDNMIGMYEEANNVWKELAGVDFDVFFKSSFNELKNDTKDAENIFSEYKDFEIE